MTPQVISLSAAGSTAWIPVDYKQNPFNISLAVVLSNTPSLTCKVEYTLDDVFNPAITPTAFVVSGLSASTTNISGSLKIPVKAIRLTISSWTSGTATLTALQGNGAVRSWQSPEELLTTSVVQQRTLGNFPERLTSRAPALVFGGDSMDISEITIVSGAPTLSVETDSVGRKRLKVVTGSGVASQISFSGATDAYFGGDAYVALQGSYEDGLSAMSMYFTPDANYSTNYVLTGAINFASAVVNPYQQPGAGSYPFVWRTGKKNNSITGSITYPFVIGTHKLVITPRAATVATVYIYGVGIGAKNKKGRCFVIADDGNTSWLTVGAPMFNDAGIPTTGSIIANAVGLSATYATLEQWKSYAAAGNAVVAHGPNGASYSSNLISAFTNNADRIADMEVSRNFIYNNGLQSQDCDLCYIWPQGDYQTASGDVSLLDDALAAGFTTARCSSLINALVQYNADAVTKYQRLTLPYSTHGWAGTTAGQVALTTALTDAITNAATYGTDIFVTFHQIVPTSTADGSMDSTKCRVSDLLTIRTAISNAVAAGTLECLTLPQIAYKPTTDFWYSL